MIAIPSAILTPPIASYLDRFERRRRRQRVVRAVGLAAALTLLWAATWCAADRFVGLHWIVRTAALLANVAFAVAIVTRPVLAALREVDVRRAAVEVERRRPSFGQRLTTVTSRALGDEAVRGSTDMLRAVGDEAAAEAAQHDPAAMLPWRLPLRPWVVVCAIAAALLALTSWPWLALPTLARRYAAPWSAVPPVTSTRLAVTPGDLKIGQGDTLVVRVAAERVGELPPVLNVRSGGQPWHEIAMSPMPRAALRGGSGAATTGAADATAVARAAAPTFEARVNDVDRDLEYFVAGGDARSPVFTATVLRRPSISAFRIRYAYPPYTRLPPRQVENTTGEIEAPAGTEVTVAIRSPVPLSIAVMTIGGGAVRMKATGDPHVQEAAFTVRDDRRYTIRMASTRDVSGAFRGGTIRAIPDRPPVVLLRAAPAGPPPAQPAPPSTLPAAPRVATSYHAADDHGLSRLDAEIILTRASTGESVRQSVPIALPDAGASPIVRGAFSPDLSSLATAPGDRIDLRLRAEDRAGQFALSPAVRFTLPGAAPTGSASTPESSPAPATPATRTTTPATRPTAPSVPPIATSQPAPLDPAGFGAALKAYFDFLRGGAGPSGDGSGGQRP